MPDGAFETRAQGLEWLLFDVDGVLTDGRLWYTAKGEEIKAFHVRDGLAFKLAQRAGLKIGIFTGRKSRPLERRCRDLGVDEMILGSKSKGEDFAVFLDRHLVAPGRVAFTGDDLIDLPVLGRCGLACCPSDAVPEVQAVVHRVLQSPGGSGAAREMIESVLKARGAWHDLVAGYSLEA